MQKSKLNLNRPYCLVARLVAFLHGGVRPRKQIREYRLAGDFV